ncbi:hypothetical protein GGD83_001408 [Rhodoblastus sphagnicola]|nr:hypothetical protein [Rhodoblastus sphagnicola]
MTWLVPVIDAVEATFRRACLDAIPRITSGEGMTAPVSPDSQTGLCVAFYFNSARIFCNSAVRSALTLG